MSAYNEALLMGANNMHFYGKLRKFSHLSTSSYGTHPQWAWITYWNVSAPVSYKENLSDNFGVEVYHWADHMTCLFWGFMAQSTHWGHVERGQFTSTKYWVSRLYGVIRNIIPELSIFLLIIMHQRMASLTANIWDAVSGIVFLFLHKNYVVGTY